MPAERVRPLVARAPRALAFGVAALLTVLASSALPARSAQIAVPKTQGYVTDLAGVIDPATRARLTELDRELRAKTGAEIAIVTVRTTKPETAFDYALAIAEQWKPGSKGKDNGVVFLVAVDDREMQILTGYGVEGPLPDGKIGEIRDTLVTPAFKKGEYSRGIWDGTATMAALIAAEYGVKLTGAPQPVSRPVRRGGGGGASVLGLILLFFVVSAFLNTLGGRGGGRRRRGGWAAPIIFGGGMGGFGRGGGGGFGGFGGDGGGGFGGFGGGGFGGGGAGGKW